MMSLIARLLVMLDASMVESIKLRSF